MLTGNWLTIDKLNQITLLIDGKRVPLRCTVYQVELFRALTEKRKEEPPKADSPGGPGRLVLENLEIAEIALNPIPNQIDFPRDAIEQKFDLDQVQILSRVWIERKVFAPRIEPDPIIGPGNPGPAPSGQ